MLENLREYSIDFNSLPYVLQLNKRDLPNVTPVNELISTLRTKNETVLEAVAVDGNGVIDTLKTISKSIMIDIRRELR